MEMRKREAGAEEALSRYRNALVAGASPAELAKLAETLDPAIVQTLHQMRQRRQAEIAGPRPDFANGLEHDLLAAFGRSPTNTVPLTLTPHMSPNGHTGDVIPHRLPTRLETVRRRWTPTHLAIAAALLLAVVGGALVARTFFPSTTTTVLDAANAPAVQTLLDTTIEGQAEGWTPLTIEHWTFQPGNAFLQISPLSGPQWVVSDAAPLMATIDGQEREIPADSGLVVLPGQALTVRNPGSEDRALIRGVAAAGFSLEEYDRQRIVRQIALDSGAHEALPPGRSRLIFDRLLLQPGATLMIEPATGLDWIEVTSGSLGLTLSGPSLPENWRSGHERDIAAGESLPALAPGTRVTLRNVGDDPLVLLRLQVIPATMTGEPTLDRAPNT